MDNWKGFHFPMGFFFGWYEGKLVIGKCDPLTKKVIEWYYYE